MRGVFAALQYECAESQFKSLGAAFHDLRLAHTVSFHRSVLPAYAAIEAVVTAVIAYFNEPANVYLVSETAQSHLPCLFVQIIIRLGASQESLVFSGRKCVLVSQAVYCVSHPSSFIKAGIVSCLYVFLQRYK